MTEKMVQKLEEGFLYGLSDRQACKYAGVNYSTFTMWAKNNPEFCTKKETLKENPKIRAQINICKSIEEGNIDDSKWYLERKDKAEFSTRQETKNENDNTNKNIDIVLTDEERTEKLKSIKERLAKLNM